MKIYNYHPETGEYTGCTDARLDPLEWKLNEVERWLLPAFATFEEPPLPDAGCYIRRVDDKWIQELIPIVKEPEPHVPTEEEIKEKAIQAEMNRLLREQAIANLTAAGKL